LCINVASDDFTIKKEKHNFEFGGGLVYTEQLEGIVPKAAPLSPNTYPQSAWPKEVAALYMPVWSI
jgi:hypothetical protein